MSYERFVPSVHTPPTVQEMKQITDDLHFSSSMDQVEALTAVATDAINVLSLLDTFCDPVPEVKYPRTPGYRPQPQDRVGNAWAWRCDVQGAPTGKLSGKTFAIKDNTAVAGVPMSNGSRLLQGYIPEYDATVVTRILDAGGRILGKSSCDDFCLSAMGFSAVDGYISMPDTPDYRVGGSSGGSAVLVATGEVDMALGADQGGSIRIPAAWTGTVGLKPTFGLVPYTGLVPIEPTVDHAGPITRNVTDCALFLEVLAGRDGLDGRQQTNLKIPEYSKFVEQELEGRKLGVLKEGFDTCVPETRAAVREFLDDVATTKFGLVDVSVPLHQHGLAICTGFFPYGCLSCLQMGTAPQFAQGLYPTSLEKAVRQGLQSSATLLAPGIRSYAAVGELFRRRYGNHYYCKGRNMVLELARQYDEALTKCDVIVMPTMTHVSPRFPGKHSTEAVTQEAYLRENSKQIVNTVVANMTGHPALTLPLGKLGDGSKDSLMIVGKKFDEVTVLQVARTLEKLIVARE
ncbi:amidase-like [Physella acuta]|uniref:amidase-like n=1 Tax=Physella acuta TaxID=109671 RepID=UPI0027DD5E36|nr:amidase-like [Physella acuta]